MKSRDISRSKIGPFSLACTDLYIGIGWENQSTSPSNPHDISHDSKGEKRQVSADSYLFTTT